MPRNIDADVTIVGAGPTGLMLAGELVRRGRSVLIADRSSGPSIHSKALAVHSRTLEIMATLGLDAAFLEGGHRLHTARVFTDGAERAVLRLDEIESDYPFVLSIPQSATERILLDRLRSMGGQVLWETTVDSIDVAEEGTTATLRPSTGGSRTVHSKWLVGCDGAHSTVRSEVGIGWSGEDIDLHFAFADLRLRSSLLRRSAFHVFLLDDSRIIGVIPLPSENSFRIINTLGPDQLDADKDVDFFGSLVTTRVDPDVVVEDADWFSEFTIRQRIAKKYRHGRAFIAGDAAHAHSPAGGQGMNTGLHDAHNLAWKLDAVLAGRADEALLDSYEAERRPIAAEVVSMTGMGTEAVGHLPIWKRKLRDIALTTLPRIAPLRRRLLDMLSEVGVAYEAGEWIVDNLGSSAGKMRAGTFIPNLATQDGGSLYDFVGSDRVIVHETGAELPRYLGDHATIVDVPHSSLAACDVTADDALFVIRPDGYVGFTGRTDDPELHEYLRR